MREVKLMISGTFNSDEPARKATTPIIPASVLDFDDEDDTFIYMMPEESIYANCVVRT